MQYAGCLVLLLIAITCQAQPSHLASLLRQESSQLYFEANRGQFASDIQYQCSDPDRQVRLLDDGLSVALLREGEGHAHVPSETHDEWLNYRWIGKYGGRFHALVWNLSLLGMDSSAHPQGYAPIEGHVNYLRSIQSVRKVPRYREVWYQGCYPHIDLRYYGTAQHQLKYDFILSPGHDLNDIQLQAQGIDSLHIDEAGELVITTAWGELVEAVPYAYQKLRGREIEIAASYRLIDDSTFGFVLGNLVDPDLPVVLDPITLSWSSFFHSSSSDDYVVAIQRDSAGYTYATGYTETVSFPTTPGVYQDSMAGMLDAFVVKMAPNGTALDYATYLGGSSWEMGYGLAIDEQGVAYVAGMTNSIDFPNSTTRFQAGYGGGSTDGFVLALSPEGDSLRFASYLGGDNRDYLYDLKRAPDGSLCVGGYTLSGDYPTTASAQDSVYGGSGDGVISRIAGDGSTLLGSTYLGGSGYEIVNALALRQDGSVWATGATSSYDFPTTADAVQSSLVSVSGGVVQDVFLAHLSADAAQLYYSSYYGGANAEEGLALTLTPDEAVVMGGLSSSTDYPTTADAFQEAGHASLGFGDAILTVFDSTGATVTYSTLYGGSNIDYIKAIQVNEHGEIYLLGSTQSTNFPRSAASASPAGGYDAFVAVFRTDTTAAGALVGASLFGGSQNDYPRANGSMDLDGEVASLAITSHSPNMPIVGPAYQGTKLNALDDAPWLGGVELDNVLSQPEVALQAAWQTEGVALTWQAQGPEPIRLSLERQAMVQPWQALATLPTEQWAQGRYLDRDLDRMAGEALSYRLTYLDPEGRWQHSPRVQLLVPSHSRGSLRLMPNPAQQYVQIQATFPGMGYGHLQIVDLLGRVYFQTPLTSEQGYWSQRLELGDWSSGQYWVLLRLAGQGVLREGLWVR